MNLKYCPNCSKDTISKETETKYVCSNCGYEFWNNPKATAAVILVKGDKILFSRRGIEPRKGLYDFPGGFLEYGENPYDACVREINEESGLNIDKTKLHLLETYSAEYVPGTSVVDMIFVITEWEGNPIANDDSAALELKPFSFMEDEQFIDVYPDLLNKLKDYLNSI